MRIYVLRCKKIFLLHQTLFKSNLNFENFKQLWYYIVRGAAYEVVLDEKSMRSSMRAKKKRWVPTKCSILGREKEQSKPFKWMDKLFISPSYSSYWHAKASRFCLKKILSFVVEEDNMYWCICDFACLFILAIVFIVPRLKKE